MIGKREKRERGAPSATFILYSLRAIKILPSIAFIESFRGLCTVIWLVNFVKFTLPVVINPTIIHTITPQMSYI